MNAKTKKCHKYLLCWLFSVLFTFLCPVLSPRRLLSGFRLESLNRRHKQEKNRWKEREAGIYFFLWLSLLQVQVLAGAASLRLGLWWGCLSALAPAHIGLAVPFPFPCSFRLGGVMASHCFWSPDAYGSVPILMCWDSPHTSKEFWDTRSASHNSTPFWQYLPRYSIRSHELRAQSHKTVPAPLSDTSRKSRFSPVLLRNWRSIGGSNNPLLGIN